jgi:plasmid stabilization system protein ParE
MPHIVIWSPQAIEDIQQAYRFLASKNLDTAQAVAKILFQQAEILEAYPEVGRPADDLEPEHRERIVSFGASGYVLLYEIINNTVIVLAVRHQKEVGY